MEGRSYLIVPENTRQLDELRRWLASLDAQDAIEVTVSHDADALAKSAIPNSLLKKDSVSLFQRRLRKTWLSLHAEIKHIECA